MGNVVNYIKWRGDLSFDDSPFNEVDNLALSLLIYNDFDGIVPEKGETSSISVKDASEWYFTKHSLMDLGRLDFDWLLYYMAKTKRFGDLRLSDYIDISDSDENMMFTAFTIHLPDGTLFVSFRGTTMDIDDWRLDFRISFEEIGAQKAAADYLKFITEKYAGDIYVGGHSKGGNLAVYSAMNVPDIVKNRIKRIYSNDGPGFAPELLDEQKFNIVKDRITHIVPTFCVVGMLFELKIPHEIVASDGEKILQHSGMTWKVEGDHFVKKRYLSEESVVYNKAIDDWIGNATMEQRQAFTRDIFDAMKAAGAVSVYDISKGGFHDFGTILLSAANSESKTKIVFGKFFGSLWRSFEKIRFVDTIKSLQGLIDIFLIFIGIIFLTIPQEVYTILGGIIALGVAIWNAVMILKAGVRDEIPFLKRGRMIFHLIVMSFMVFILSNLERIPTWTNVLMAIVFFSLVVASIRYVVKNKKTISGKAKFWMILVAVVNLNIGIVSLVTPQQLDYGKSLTVGSYLILVGIVRFIIQLLEQTQNNVEPSRYYEED
ncbi:MAG: DUF2974 domain-containing protein [Butyrivibrio sp.]|nr:DUF2974 domain-containing protein [Butyrivibrio sp.]